MSLLNAEKNLVLKSLLLSIFSVFGIFIWQGSHGFSLWDEGFLWYGVQRVISGEVPIRDFMAYEPGRYYWSAALMRIWGNNGIMSLRLSVAIFQTMGLFIGSCLIARTLKTQNFLYLLLSVLILVIWMFPRHKLFDISLSIFLIGTLVFLIEQPTAKRYFLAGLYLGLIACFGRNHGIYGAFGSIGAIAWLNIGRAEAPTLPQEIGYWASGIVVGFSPILLMALYVPGFGSAYLNNILFLFEVNATNLPLPVPWPWLINFRSSSLEEIFRGVFTGFFFIATVAFGVISVIWSVRQKIVGDWISPAFVAASFLALPYAHFAYSRADVGHLAQGIFPLLIGCLVSIAYQPSKIKWSLALLLLAASLSVIYPFHPGWQCHIRKHCEEVEISGSNLQIDPSTANDVRMLRELTNQYTKNGQGFLVEPFWPGAYALLQQKSPAWEIYPLFPRSPAFEKAEIQRISANNLGFVLVLDQPLDGREELRFKNTHPITYQYILDNFERIPKSPNPNYQIYKKMDVR